MQTECLAITHEKSLSRALTVLQEGGILLFPTETVYGLGVDSADADAMDRLYEIKGRPREKPFQWLVHDAGIVQKNSAEWSDKAGKLAAAFWPGPMTMVLPSKDGSVGWRIPNHPRLLELLKRLDRPLISTSANLSGEPPALSCEEGIQKLGERVHLALDGGRVQLGAPSSVVRVRGDQVEILREGALSKERILDAAGS